MKQQHYAARHRVSIGACGRPRTDDPLVGSQVLCHLSYTRLEQATGLEPVILRLGKPTFYRLNYTCMAEGRGVEPRAVTRPRFSRPVASHSGSTLQTSGECEDRTHAGCEPGIGLAGRPLTTRATLQSFV